MPKTLTHKKGDYPILLSERIWQFIRFSVVTGVIFVLFFLTINFQAYRQIFSSIFDPAAQAQAQEVLENATTGSSPSLQVAKALEPLPTKKETRKVFAWIDMPIVPTDNRLVIPKIGKSVPVIEMGTENIEGENWTELEKQIQSGLKDGVVHYPGTAKPGQFGNVFITGHSSYYVWDNGKFKDVFALLSKLEVGDRFYIYYNQIQYTYEVKEKTEVPPSNVSVLEQPKDQKLVTLMTCTPVGTTLRRLIIRAEEV